MPPSPPLSVSESARHDISRLLEQTQREFGRAPTLLEIRAHLDLTQRQMARLCDVSVRTYLYWETGVYAPRVGSRRALMRALGIPFERHREVLGEPARFAIKRKLQAVADAAAATNGERASS